MINDKLFYKIVNSQRDCRAQKLTQLQVDGEMLQKSDDIAEGWIRYFQNLSKRLDKYTRDGPPNLKCSADNNCSSWDLPFFITHTNLSNNSRLTNSVSDL
jgi:hypothetical protein